MDLSTKLLLLSLSGAAGLFVGLCFSNRLKRKRDFYKEFLTFLDGVIGDIGFRKEGIKRIASSCVADCKSRFKGILEQYCQSPNEIPRADFLSGQESTVFKELFAGLGKSDPITQKSELEHSREKIKEFGASYTQQCNSRCAIYIKLGLLAGLAVGILLM